MVARDLFLGCLNPYCSGRWSRTVMTLGDNVQLNGLNPYCSGRWSRTIKASRDAEIKSS